MNKDYQEAQDIELRIVKTIEKLGNPLPGAAELAAMLVFLHAAKQKMPEKFAEGEALARSLISENND